MIGLNPLGLNMQISNFGWLDPDLRRKGIVSLVNGSKLDDTVCNKFSMNLYKLLEN